ncbi:MAG: hypothetical protein GWP02_06630 [Desulfobulbaceae bacterium]|nr:hypothetical protein [Desulfobulbaceae bacterium]
MTVGGKKFISVLSALVLLVAGIPATVFANAHPHPRADSLPYLDQSTYIRNMAVRAHVGGEDRRWKMQMMSLGERRFLFQGGKPKGNVLEVTDPLNPVVINESRPPDSARLQRRYQQVDSHDRRSATRDQGNNRVPARQV